ncbi:MAG: aspartate/glutamate racemase [Gammaproteobacteria bacterium]|nr:MAG: aspartate/glutamate racemase [Gammaproteobacteria bacterium]
MKTLGILGGMSYESTASYYTLINQKINERLGKSHSAKLLIASVDFEDVVQQQKLADWQAAGNLLAGQAKALQLAGAEGILLATNTMHKVADNIKAEISVPFLHIIECMADELQANGIEIVGLLGTAFTMQDGFYHQLLESRGIKVVTPDTDTQIEIHRIIFDELCHGKVLDDSCDIYIQAIQQLKDNQAQAVILGCTEIGLMIHQHNSPLPVFDSTLVHVNKAVEWVLN